LIIYQKQTRANDEIATTFNKIFNHLQIFVISFEDINGHLIAIGVCQVFSYDGRFYSSINPLFALSLLKYLESPSFEINQSFEFQPVNKVCKYPTDGYLGISEYEISK
jgi:hypothetical protein